MALGKWINALGRTRKTVFSGISRLFGGGPPDPETLDEVEESLLAADIPVRLTGVLIDQLRENANRDDWRQPLRDSLLTALGPTVPFDWQVETTPTVILIVGVNGSGKTTTAAKLARMALANGQTPLLGAADTFRAAGSDQLRLWAERVGCDVVGGQQGSDSAAVAYDALSAAVARNADLVLIDTAGRMHTKRPLLDELTKIKRSLGKRVPGAPHHTWMVLDATLGNNALRQAEMFHEAVGLNGIIVSKLDGSAKAGFLLSAAQSLHIPILFAGLGEGADDLTPFDRESFVDALLGDPGDAAS